MRACLADFVIPTLVLIACNISRARTSAVLLGSWRTAILAVVVLRRTSPPAAGIPLTLAEDRAARVVGSALRGQRSTIPATARPADQRRT